MRRSVKRVMIGVAGVLGLTLAYGVAVEPRLILEEKRLEVALPGLGEAWTGAEVAVLADLQVGMWLANEGMVERAVDQVVEEDPDAVLLAGDFVYSGSPGALEQVVETIELLVPLIEGGTPIYAVMGNHDYKVGAVDELTVAFTAVGITVLRNEAALIPPPAGLGAPLYVVGVGPARPRAADVAEALADVPVDAPRLVMMHNPTTFPDFPARTAPFAVAGHTHCGQVALPGLPSWTYLGLSAEEALVADGFAPPEYGSAGNELFVSCGIGFSVLPMRINAPPQLVFLELATG